MTDSLFLCKITESLKLMRSKQLLRNLKKALKQDHLYSSDEIDFMKKQLSLLEEELTPKQKEFKGFGK